MGFSASPAQPVPHLVLQQGCVAQVFIDGVGGHLGDVLCCLGLDVQGDEAIRHQVMDRLKALLPHKVLPVIEQSVVQGLVPKPGEREVERVGGWGERLVSKCVCVYCTLRPRCVSLAVSGSL